MKWNRLYEAGNDRCSYVSGEWKITPAYRSSYTRGCLNTPDGWNVSHNGEHKVRRDTLKKAKSYAEKNL